MLEQPLYERAPLPGCGGVRWGLTLIPSQPLCTTKAMPRSVYSGFFLPLRSLLIGYKIKAIPSTRWMRTSYAIISLG
jgi:hypothetical protein